MMYKLCACFSLGNWAREQGKVAEVEAPLGKQGVRLEDEQLQRRSDTSGGTR